jgi:hypothetical protein
MINEIFIIIILYLIVNQIILAFKQNTTSKDTTDTVSENLSNTTENDEKKAISLTMFGKPSYIEENKYIAWSFNKPKPWSRIIYSYEDEYEFKFFLKVKIPSLNDYENWLKIIPNLDFITKTSELIIPSKDEASALAIANLIVSNFSGNISIKEIMEKDLITISVSKAIKYPMVRNKLKEQIMDLLNGEQPKESCSTGTCNLSKETVVNDYNNKQNNVADYSLDFTKKTNKDNLTPNAANQTSYMEIEPFANNSEYSFI